MNGTRSENRNFRNFGDLYMSIADYSYFESIDFEYTFYLDLLFRRHVYVEESMFFVKELPFSKFALQPKGHIHAAIREGIIRPLNKEINATSFEELATRYPHLRFNDPSLRPETLDEDMIQLSKRYDQMYTGADGGVKIRTISLDEARYYNQDLKTILQQTSPPTLENTAQTTVLENAWKKTEKFRFDWIDQVVSQAEAKGLASAPKTAFNKLGADLMGIPYLDLKNLITYAPTHPQGEQVIAFLRWVHEIFYYSRSRAINAATTYALKPRHITVPFLYSLRDTQGFGEDLSVKQSIKLPTRQALTKMSSSRLLRLRETEEAADFYQAMLAWQISGHDDDRKVLVEALQKYTSTICDAAAKSGEHAVVERLIRIDNGSLKSLLGTLSIVGAVTTFVTPISSMLPNLSPLATATAGILGTASGAIASLSFLSGKLAQHRSVRSAKAVLHGHNTLDVDSTDTLISC